MMSRKFVFTILIIVSGNLFFPKSYSQEIDSTVRFIDSILARQQFVKDSILAREIFVRDSILAREVFVRDSILRRQKMLDSLNFLKKELTFLLPAYFRAINDEIILMCNEMQLIGDSTLGNFSFVTMPFGVREPYTPWKSNIILSGKKVKFEFDKPGGKIISVHTSQMKASFIRSSRKLLIINRPAVIQNNSRGQFYKNPVDSVFFDDRGRIVQIQSYILFHALLNGNQRGNLLFTNHNETRQYEYNSLNELVRYRVVRFCERWKVWETNKVCSTIDYSLEHDDNTYILKRSNNPPNSYSEGTYTLLYDELQNLKSISFINSAKTENWQRTIELNKDGNVSCYMDKSGEVTLQSLCIIYHDPNSKIPIETITTTFEKDGISYYQKNNTTGKSRTRDRMTLEWGPWR